MSAHEQQRGRPRTGAYGSPRTARETGRWRELSGSQPAPWCRPYGAVARRLLFESRDQAAFPNGRGPIDAGGSRRRGTVLKGPGRARTPDARAASGTTSGAGPRLRRPRRPRWSSGPAGHRAARRDAPRGASCTRSRPRSRSAPPSSGYSAATRTDLRAQERRGMSYLALEPTGRPGAAVTPARPDHRGRPAARDGEGLGARRHRRVHLRGHPARARRGGRHRRSRAGLMPGAALRAIAKTGAFRRRRTGSTCPGRGATRAAAGSSGGRSAATRSRRSMLWPEEDRSRRSVLDADLLHRLSAACGAHQLELTVDGPMKPVAIRAAARAPAG